ncbi:MAG: hypothetical protein BJ554DRAFT_199 [Olpidium bornovanus]|uniref:Uncharacterized protein n=1 Tax=Olpidium bornovanus TaxID=278681 RepID=A0A8H8DIB4_9FUNG|nr:MAG: hypothetical protein BJ554DRAFT_199 [Olpidium bornovanus]
MDESAPAAEEEGEEEVEEEEVEEVEEEEEEEQAAAGKGNAARELTSDQHSEAAEAAGAVAGKTGAKPTEPPKKVKQLTQKPPKRPKPLPTEKAAAGQRHVPGSDQRLKEMEECVEKEKATILASKDMLEEERKAILLQLDLRAKEISLEQEQRAALAAQLQQMQEKLLVGGVNVLDKHTQQEQAIAKARGELEEAKRKQLELVRELEEQEEQQLQIEESYSSLQEEAAIKTKKLKRLWNMLMQHKAEIKDLQAEHQREREDLLETVRDLTRELRLKALVISAFIPEEEQRLIEMSTEYDEVADKLKIAHIAHAGNNIRERTQAGGMLGGGGGAGRSSGATEGPFGSWDALLGFPDVYLTYESATGISPKGGGDLSAGGGVGPRQKHSARSGGGGGGARPDAAAPRKGKGPGSALRFAKDGGALSSPAQADEESAAAAAEAPKARGLVRKAKHYA